ncbi:unnamed protein product [Phytophthora fragariaefolia]|uniref:Unnamed protein product n=1 Tax=Phytophthora fragariaefolia TaxID=1490495 RepID=A0A9W6X4M6_9STRA|nr:unnamed protein product [Phytophthora fragariaefolia]
MRRFNGGGTGALPAREGKHPYGCKRRLRRRDLRSSLTYVEHFQGKKVVVVLDNGPAHSQMEERVEEHDDLVLLRLAPVLKAKIKVDLALSREELIAIRPRGTIAAARMAILERAAKRCIDCMDLRLVKKMALHCQHAVAAAERQENMQYGTGSDVCLENPLCSALAGHAMARLWITVIDKRVALQDEARSEVLIKKRKRNLTATQTRATKKAKMVSHAVAVGKGIQTSERRPEGTTAGGGQDAWGRGGHRCDGAARHGFTVAITSRH